MILEGIHTGPSPTMLTAMQTDYERNEDANSDEAESQMSGKRELLLGGRRPSEEEKEGSSLDFDAPLFPRRDGRH